MNLDLPRRRLCDGPVPVATGRDPDWRSRSSKLGDMDCEHRLNIPHSAVMPPSTNSRAPVM